MNSLIEEWHRVEKRWNEIGLSKDEFVDELLSLVERFDAEISKEEDDLDRLQWSLQQGKDERDTIMSHLENKDRLL